MNLRRLTFLVAIVTGPVVTARAQTPALGPIVLVLPSSARTLALGDVGVTSRDDDVLFFNPAQLAVANGYSISAERFSSNVGLTALSAVTRFNGGGIGIGMRMANYYLPGSGSFLLAAPPTVPSLFEASTVPATSLEASVGLAQIVKGWRVGVAGKVAQDEDVGSRFLRGLVDVGVSKQIFNSYTVGASIQNIGEDFHRTLGPGPSPILISGTEPLGDDAAVELPRQATVGVSRGGQLGEFDWFATTAVSWIRTNTLSPAGGLEMNYSWLSGYNIALRLGARRPLPGEDAVTAGAGFTMDRLSIDYALETLSGGRIGNRIGLRIR
jgi:hypothetical protein